MHHWLGRKHNPETLLKIGEASKRTWKDPNFRERQIAARKKYRHSAESRAKISAANKGKSHPGHKHSAESRAKISSALRGRPSPLRGRKRDPQIVEKTASKLRGRSNSLLGRPKSAEHRANISKGLMGRPGPHYSHTPEAKAKISMSAMGNKRGLGRRDSPEVKAKRAESVARFFDQWPRPITSLERAMYHLLREAGFSFVCQKHVGSRIVDAYVPSHNLAFEADGAYWHNDPEKEIERDEYLLSKGILAVIHLSEQELQCLV